MISGTDPPWRRRAQAWLLTGPVGHLLGGALDLAQALVQYRVQRARARRAG